MKKILFTVQLLTAYFLLLITPAYAITPTPTGEPTSTKSLLKQATDTSNVINELKERIASRVAQLKLVERRGIIGTVTDVSDTQITIHDVGDNTRFVDVDELTKFSSPSAKEAFGISDITKGTKLGILGLYNKQSRRLLARFVDVVSLSKIIHGAVVSVDKEAFGAKVISDTAEVITVDIETVTKTLQYTKSTGLIRSGFSKIQQGQHVIVIGFTDVRDQKRIIASRFIAFSEIPQNPNIVIPEETITSQSDVVISTGSGNKLTPLR